MKNNNYNFAVSTALNFLSVDKFDLKFDFIEDKSIIGLEIEKSGENVIIKFSEKAFLFRALGLLKERINETEFIYSENASFTMNGIMIDCSRNGVANLSTLKDMILKLSLMGHNTLMLYTEDTYEVEGQPYFGYFRGRYSVAELKEIDAYAKSFGIELIPCIQTLAHISNALKWNGVYGNITDTEDVLLAGEDETYKFIEDLIKSCSKAFSSRRIHIGLDEAFNMCRGKFYDKNGNCDRQKVFVKHLKKVINICEKYGFRFMMWGDMPFRLARGGSYEYDDITSDGVKFKELFQKNCDLVYWDYYSTKAETYEQRILMHKKTSDNIIFAGGAWRWSNLAARNTYSLDISRLALQKCREHGIKEVFTTLWGDDGNESSFYSSWPTVQLFAEYGFSENVSNEKLAMRFKTCTKGDLSAFCDIDAINNPCGVKSNNENIAKALLYQDPMMGMFDCYVQEGFNNHYAECAKKMYEYEIICPEYAHMFANLGALCDVLADKCELGIKIKATYDNGKKDELKSIVGNVIPRLINNTEKLCQTYFEQWQIENKMFGFEVTDIRVNGVIGRLKTAKKRIESYLNGEIQKLEELEEERLLYNGCEIADGYLWSRIASASHFIGH